MFSPFQSRRRRHYQGGHTLVLLTFLAPLGALALSWSSIVDKKLAKEVEAWGVGSAQELERGYQFPLAYFLF